MLVRVGPTDHGTPCAIVLLDDHDRLGCALQSPKGTYMHAQGHEY
jgi:hypothetical protein